MIATAPTTGFFPAGLTRLEAHPTLLSEKGFGPSTFVLLFVVVLLGVPSVLVVGPLGAAGGPATLLAMVALGWWGVAKLVPGGMAWGFSPIRWTVGAFGVAMMAGYAAAAMRPLNGVEARGADRGLLAMAGMVGIALLTADGIPSKETLHKVLRYLVNAATALACVGLVQFFTGLDPAAYIRIPGLSINSAYADVLFIQAREGFRRVQGTSSHPIEYGMLLAMVLPIALYLLRTAPPELRRRRWLCFILIAVGIPMSLSRAAILGIFAGGLLLWCGWPLHLKKKAIKALVFYTIGMRLLVDGLIGTIKGLFLNMGNDPSYIGRTKDYTAVGELVSQAPWIGHGLGTFDPSVYFILDNQYLGTLIETGFVGLIATIVMFIVGFFTARSVYRLSKKADIGSYGELGRALAASMLVIITGYVTFDALSFQMVAGMLFLLLGIIGATWRLARVEAATQAVPA
jgi:O-antigen ligase